MHYKVLHLSQLNDRQLNERVPEGCSLVSVCYAEKKFVAVFECEGDPPPPEPGGKIATIHAKPSEDPDMPTGPGDVVELGDIKKVSKDW